MNRRAFVFALATLTTWLGPFSFLSAAHAQQPAAPRRIGALLLVFTAE